MRPWWAATVLALLLGLTRPALAQQPARRVHAELTGGFANALEDDAYAPGGGPLVSAFVGRAVGRLVTLGVTLGWRRYVDGTRPFDVRCPPPEPSPPDCVRQRDAEQEALDVALAVRVGPTTGAWRPYATATAGVYRVALKEVEFTTDRAGEVLLTPVFVSSGAATGGGISLGVGLGHAPGGGRWTIVGGVRVHAIANPPLRSETSFFPAELGSWLDVGLGLGLQF